uniref:ATP-binding cassette domain-containing protein n=1 Tax=Rubrimonas sp. TaxID=2036015 RepID=UPI002FDE5668
MTPVLEARGLRKSYGALRVTDGVDLDVRAGEVHALIGPNGAGKTTLIAQIAGAL